MKKLFFFCAALFALTAQAEEITLNLATAVNTDGAGIEYNAENIMDSTYSEDYRWSPFIFTNDYALMFSHLPSGSSWGGTSWEGFTFSKKNADTGNQFECVAKGGLLGEGTPFVVGYYSEYFTNNSTDYPSSNVIVFDDTYYPKEVYICQSSNTLKALKEGMTPARPFTDKDTLALIITAINNQYVEVGKSVVYHLAVDGKFNQGWEKVDLSTLDACAGLSFRMTSTDSSLSDWDGVIYMNTPAYFALDGLTISTEKVETGIQNVETSVKATKRLVNGELIIEHNGNTYNATGQLRK